MIKHIKQTSLTTNKWSGGTTTEIFIAPEQSLYKERNFDWRLSTATVEVAQSEFTSLPGVNRAIMSLDKDLKLCHENQYTVELKPFEVDYFKGDWTTRSEGRVTDFNLMTMNGFHGKLETLTVNVNEKRLPLKNIVGLYTPFSTIICKMDKDVYTLEAGDLLIIDDGCVNEVVVESLHETCVIFIEITRP